MWHAHCDAKFIRVVSWSPIYFFLGGIIFVDFNGLAEFLEGLEQVLGDKFKLAFINRTPFNKADRGFTDKIQVWAF